MTPPFALSILISFLLALLAMAFFTLLERKAIGYFQIRKGPNKVGIMGLPQPFADALKLFAKEQRKPTLANTAPFILAPVTALLLALLLWSLFPFSAPASYITFGVIFFLCVSSLTVYSTLAAGWASNSKYALLGALRRIAQTISYEVRIALILLATLLILLSFNIYEMTSYQKSWPLFIALPLFLTWFTTTLAETNRTPFDFAEGESELVSGFNIEYSAGGFALIFMAEYASILIISIFSARFFTGSLPLIDLSLTFKTLLLAFIFIWIRAAYPRMRYDRLMALTWKRFLPFSLAALLITVPLIPLLLWYCAGLNG